MHWQPNASRLVKAAAKFAMSLWEGTNGTYHFLAILPQAGLMRPIGSDFAVSGPAEEQPTDDLLTVPSEIANARQLHSRSGDHDRAGNLVLGNVSQTANQA